MFYDDDINSIWKNDNTLECFTAPKQTSQSDIAFVSLQNSNHAVLHNSNTLTLKNPHNNNINFRELLKPQSNVNYSELVSRIIFKTDQQASIFLQQKLKSLNKSDINQLVDAVLQRAFPLITNRFGNFLVQRVIDLDDVGYKLRIVNSIACQVESIAMNSYGTHVLQKLLSTSPEHVKILLVNELLNGNIAQGIVHKNASHVWSKVLESQWFIYSPPIMIAVNAAMKYRWVECANTDTGSLIIQYILSKEFSEACFNEITTCALNKWGSTVVQYLVETASNMSLDRVTCLLIYSYKQLSVNFYGARCLMACLTIGGKKDYAIDLLSDLLFNDPDRIDTLANLMASSIGAQFIVNILSLMSNEKYQQFLTLIHAVKKHNAGVIA